LRSDDSAARLGGGDARDHDAVIAPYAKEHRSVKTVVACDHDHHGISRT